MVKVGDVLKVRYIIDEITEEETLQVTKAYYDKKSHTWDIGCVSPRDEFREFHLSDRHKSRTSWHWFWPDGDDEGNLIIGETYIDLVSD